MKFLISSVEYGEDNVDILEAYPGLSDFGYKILNAVVCSFDERICVEINSIEDLIELKNAIGEVLTIIAEDHEWYGIEIGSSCSR